MICRHCRDHNHQECRGGTWCDCQHRQSPATPTPQPHPSEGADDPVQH